MAEHDYLVISKTTTGDTGRIVPERDDKIFQVEPDEASALAIFNRMIRGNNMRRVGHQKFTTQHEYPHRREITVTTAASAGDTSIVVDNIDFIRRDMAFYHPATEQQIIVDADPSSTTVSVLALAQAISAGDRIIRIARVGVESWSSLKALSRAPGSHTDFITTWQSKWGVSWHYTQTNTYGPNEEARINRQGMREFNRDINAGLILNEPRDGSSDGRYIGSGLLYYGNRFNRFTVGEWLTLKTLFQGLGYMRKLTGVQNNIVAHSSCRLVSEFALWGHREGIVRRDANAKENTYGVGPVTIVNPYGVGSIPVFPDYVFDENGLDDIFMIVVYPVIQPAVFGEILHIKPSAAVPEGSAGRDTGDIAATMTRCLGIWNSYPEGSVLAFHNVKSVRA